MARDCRRGEGTHMAPGSLDGRRAMVIGAEFPAGAAIARAYAAAGADVALCSLTADEAVLRSRAVKRQVEAMGRRVAEYVMDVTLGKNVQVTTRQIVKEIGGLDLVASAPELFLDRSIARTSDTELARVMQVNFAAQFFVVRAVADEFRRDRPDGQGGVRRGGSITLVVSGLEATGEASATAYLAALAAVQSLVQSAARELAPEGIVVNGIALGRIEGDALASTPARDEEIGAAAVLLASEAASSGIVGRIIPVGGAAQQ